MYYCKVESYHTDEPVYQKLTGGKDYYFFAEARVARDYVSRGVYEKSIIEMVYEKFDSRIRNKVFIDIGAHMGMYALRMADKAKRVVAFECSPKSFNYLCANIALQGLDYNIDKYNVALTHRVRRENPTESESQSKGPLKGAKGPFGDKALYYIRDPLDGGGNGIQKTPRDEMALALMQQEPKESSKAIYPKGFRMVEVPTACLDDYNLEEVGFIKIDVEGHEKEVLEGSVETLKCNDYPPILFESWHPKEGDTPEEARFKLQRRKELFEFLESLGYAVRGIQINGYAWTEEFIAIKDLKDL